MSKRSQKKNSQTRAAKPKGLVVGHLLPVHPTSGTGAKPDGWLLCMTPEEGDVVVLPPLDRVLLEMPKKARERVANGIWWLSDERFDLEQAQDVIAEAAQEHDWDDIDFCDDCLIAENGKGCGAFGTVEEHGFAPRLPPPPSLDAEDVDDIAQTLLAADEDGLAFELLQAALARFCALKPREQEKVEVTMTLDEAAEVLGLDLSDGDLESADVERAFRAAVAKHHPDVGGDPEAMKRVLQAKRRLDAERAS